MAKEQGKSKKTKTSVPDEPKPIVVTEQNIVDTLELNYMPYTMSVIVSRAIPEIDGLKPAHRKLLFTMFKMGLLNGGRIKSADVVGQTMRVHPHGDGAIYETLVRLTRGNDSLLHAFIDSKGNFGKIYSRDMAYAASRYTEVKLDAFCQEMFKDIDKNTVDFIDNYNGRMKEPILLPSTFPNLLVTPNQGIAVGMASSICSFNLTEICNAAIEYSKNPNVDFVSLIQGPDFSTGGELLYDEDEIRNIYETGRGSFKVRGKYRFDKKNSCIEIYEIPYTTTIEAIIDKIIALVKSGKLKEITDVRDETDLSGLKLTIDIRKNADPEQLMQKIYASTTMLDSFSCNFNILVKGRPRLMGLREIFAEWFAFRIGCIRRRLTYDLDKNNEKLHLLEGLSKILLDIDKAIKIIRETEQDKQVIPNLMKGFSIDQVQAEFVAEIKLRNLNKEYLLNRINEIDGLKKEIAQINDLLSSDKKIEGIIRAELKEVAKKYGKPRKTDIIYQLNEIEVNDEMFIEDYSLKLFLTAHSYLKKISLVSLRAASDHYLKESDTVIQEIETMNKSELLLFSDKFNVYKIKVHEIPDCKASSIGEFLVNLLETDDDERIIYITTADDYAGFMLFGFENGKVAKVGMDNYSTKTNRKRLVNAYSNKSKLVYIGRFKEEADVVTIRDNDKALLFNTALLTLFNSKNTVGMQVINLKKNSIMSRILVGAELASEDIEYYRTTKIPTAGHFITEKDKANNNMTSQISLL